MSKPIKFICRTDKHDVKLSDAKDVQAKETANGAVQISAKCPAHGTKLSTFAKRESVVGHSIKPLSAAERAASKKKAEAKRSAKASKKSAKEAKKSAKEAKRSEKK
jgi:hypothetical protein